MGYGLDPPSACKLAQVLESRDDADDCLRRVITHLERSNKPSAMVMKMLKQIKSGDCVDECTHAPSIGSYLHKEANKANAQSDSSRRDRSRGKKSRDQDCD